MKRIFYSVGFFLSILFFQVAVFSQQFSLLKDINYGNPGLCLGTAPGPQNLVDVNGTLFFSLSVNLWKSDGTSNGTSLVKAIGSTIDNFVNANGTLFFRKGNSELWKSDGTDGGTSALKTGSSTISDLINNNGVLYFTVPVAGGKELWKSDGTVAGTQLVKAFTGIASLGIFNGSVLFWGTSALPASDGLYKSDGTEAGTVLVKENVYSAEYLVANGVAYFAGRDAAANDLELWKTDGTNAGTVRVKDIEPGTTGSGARNLTLANGVIYFFANTSVDGAALWKTDGSDAGTIMVKNNFDGANLVNVNGTLFFRAYTNTNGYELWKSDGTETGTAMVKDIFPGSSGGDLLSGNPTNLTNVNGILYFSATSEDAPPGVPVTCVYNNDELWKSDGTEAGTVMVKDIFKGSGPSQPQKLVNVNGVLFFSASDGLTGVELWKSNGTGSGTTLVKDITPTAGSDPKYFTLMNGQVYFNAFDAHSGPAFARGQEVHKTDGTVSGTYQLAEVFGLGSSFPNQLTNVNGMLFFSANNGSHGYELFMSDGILGGTTKMVKDINPLFGSAPDRGSNPSSLMPINGALYFSAMDGTNGYELWKTDGTDAGTIMVKNINPAAANSNPSNLVNLNGVLYFTADDGTNGKELWKSDGTDAGTVMIKNINPGSNSSDPSYLTVINGTIYFAATDGSNGAELWKSDGTDAGTIMIKNINAAGNNSSPALLKNINGVLYFIADNGTEGIELWKSDGTEAGTVMVKDINPGINSSNPASLTGIDGTVYFAADGGTGGNEIWRSNGTEAGTFLIKDINPGISGSNPTVLTKVGNNLLFAANDGVTGNEVWISNGTEAGTRLLFDIESGINSSDPSEIFEYNAKVLVAANNSSTGREVWIADAPANSPLPLTLLAFKGSIVNNDGQLQWKTDNELNTASFIVERSIDGRNYKPIGSVTSANTPGIHYYDFTDAGITSIGVADFYYRLKQTDIDGKYTYSNIVVLSVANGKNFVLLYPNPVKDKINMTINVSQKEKLQWQLVDNMGRKVKAGNYDLSPGSIGVSIDIAGLSSGMYLIQLNSSSLQKVIKVIKQ